MLQDIIELIEKNVHNDFEKRKMLSFLTGSTSHKKISPEEDEFLEKYDQAIMEMTQLNFSKKFDIEKYEDSIQSYLKLTLNHLNDELREKAVSKALVKIMLSMSSMEKSIVITTNRDNIITLFFSNIPELKGMNIEGQNADRLYKDETILSISDEQEYFIRVCKVNLQKIVPERPAMVKTMAPYLLQGFEGILYHIRLDD